MKAMVLESMAPMSRRPEPLVLRNMPVPDPGPGEIRLKVTACGVCHTELDEIEGRLPPSVLPMIPGHQIVGFVDRCGPGTDRYALGDRLGVAWIHGACGKCDVCRKGCENLCNGFRGTGRDAHGGYAEFTVVPEAFAYPIPRRFTDVAAAPLLCAGAIGYRSIRLCNMENGRSLGLTGFGASAHLVLKMVRFLYPATNVFVFARNPDEQRFARELGALWAGDSTDPPPEPIDAIIDTTPAWNPVVAALEHLKPGGRLVINAIRKEADDREALAAIDYPRHLWMEKEIKSVANVTRADVTAFLDIADRMGVDPQTETFPLESANIALQQLKARQIRGAKVLVMPA